MGIWRRVEDWVAGGNRARVAVVGAGYVGRGIVHRLERSPGMSASLVVNRTLERALEAYEAAGRPRAEIVASDDPDELERAVAAGRPAVTSSASALPAVGSIDVVVEATGAIDHGARVILAAIRAGKDVVSMNAEVDATIGYLLHDVARGRGVVYTIADGDQPGVMLRHVEFVAGLGFEIVAAVNCKRNLDVHQTPDDSRGYAARDNTSLLMTTAFGDGTKMNIENAVVANAAGLPPDRRGMHGVQTCLADAARDIVAALSRWGVVEYTLGGDFAAGVGVVGYAEDPEMVQPYMRYFKMGEGPHYFFFRPYHLVHLEVPVTVAEVVLDGIPLRAVAGPPVAEVVAIAKRDLAAGERLDGVGGYACYGQIDTVAGAEGLLPIGLTEHATLVRPVPLDHPIPLAALELDSEAEIVVLRRRQDDLVRTAMASTASPARP